MSHLETGELLELHFGELPTERRETASAHVRDCAACRALLADFTWTEEALHTGFEESPPADGLQRVLARIEAVRPARERRRHWLRTLGPCAAAVLAGGVAAHQGGLAGLLALMAVGSILTLALAPVLILESQRRS